MALTTEMLNAMLANMTAEEIARQHKLKADSHAKAGVILPPVPGTAPVQSVPTMVPPVTPKGKAKAKPATTAVPVPALASGFVPIAVPPKPVVAKTATAKRAAKVEKAAVLVVDLGTNAQGKPMTIGVQQGDRLTWAQRKDGTWFRPSNYDGNVILRGVGKSEETFTLEHFAALMSAAPIMTAWLTTNMATIAELRDNRTDDELDADGSPR